MAECGSPAPHQCRNASRRIQDAPARKPEMAAHTQGPVTILPVQTKADKREFVELAFRLNRGDPAWVPPLKGELFDLLTPGKNPWFEHGKAQLLLARRDGRTVGRISRSEEHTSELQSLMRSSYAVFCLNNKH